MCLHFYVHDVMMHAFNFAGSVKQAERSERLHTLSIQQVWRAQMQGMQKKWLTGGYACLCWEEKGVCLCMSSEYVPTRARTTYAHEQHARERAHTNTLTRADALLLTAIILGASLRYIFAPMHIRRRSTVLARKFIISTVAIQRWLRDIIWSKRLYVLDRIRNVAWRFLMRVHIKKKRRHCR